MSAKSEAKKAKKATVKSETAAIEATANGITSKVVRRGQWTSNKTYEKLLLASPFSAPDNMIYDAFRNVLCASELPELMRWQMKATSNGAFFLVPQMDATNIELCSPNGHSGTLSLEGAGIVASLYGINLLAWQPRSASAADTYERLVRFA